MANETIAHALFGWILLKSQVQLMDLRSIRLCVLSFDAD